MVDIIIQKNISHLIPLMRDLLNLHYGFSEAQSSLLPLSVPDNEFSHNTSYSLSDDVILLSFSASPELLAECGMIDLAEYFEQIEMVENTSRALFYNNNGTADMIELEDLTGIHNL